MSRTISLTIGVAILLVACAAACDKSPTRPSGPTSEPPAVPASPTAPTLQAIHIDGPVLVAPAGTAHYVASGQFSDGTTSDVTNAVTWRSSDGNVLALSSDGTASAGRAGQSVIVAETRQARAALEVLVLPPGTFRLTGTAREAGLPVSGAAVDVLEGSRAVISAKTAFDGTFRLFGVAGDIEVRVRKEGYDDRVNRLTVSANASSDFELKQTAPSNLAGSYELTVTAASTCPSSGTGALPPDVRARTYSAVITQDGARLNVVLGGASLVSGSFKGRVEPGLVTFEINGPAFYYFYFASPLDLLEELTPTSLLIVSGRVSGTPSPASISGTLNGLLSVVANPIVGTPRTSASCTGSHKFVLTKH